MYNAGLIELGCAAGGHIGVASKGDGLQTVRSIQCFLHKQVSIALHRCASKGLPWEHDTHLEFFDKEGEIGENGGEYKEEYIGAWWGC